MQTRIHSRIHKLLHSRHRHESVSWSVLSPPLPGALHHLCVGTRSSNSTSWVSSFPAQYMDTDTSTASTRRADCKTSSSHSSSAGTSRDNGRRLHDVQLHEKMRMTFVDELQLLNIHGLEHCLLNDWNVNNLVHYTTDESESESQSRNCSMSELDCRKLLLHVRRVSRLSPKRHDLRELVSACS